MFVGVNVDSLDEESKKLLTFDSLGELGSSLILLGKVIDLIGDEVNRHIAQTFGIKRLEWLKPVIEESCKVLPKELEKLRNKLYEKVAAGISHKYEWDVIFVVVLAGTVSEMLKLTGDDFVRSAIDLLKEQFGATTFSEDEVDNDTP